MEKQILDANLLIRFLRDDHAEHSPRARALIARAAFTTSLVRKLQ